MLPPSEMPPGAIRCSSFSSSRFRCFITFTSLLSGMATSRLFGTEGSGRTGCRKEHPSRFPSEGPQVARGRKLSGPGREFVRASTHWVGARPMPAVRPPSQERSGDARSTASPVVADARSPERPEELDGVARGFDRHVAVAAQLEGGRAVVIDLTQGRHGGGEVEVTFAGEQVLVAVATHALEVHVDDLAREAPDGFRRALLGHVRVADVERETEARLSDPVADAAETRQVLDVHTGLGLEAQHDPVLGGIARENP